MIIVVSGSHATGKSTLIGDFTELHPEFEQWGDPFELVEESATVADGFAAQLEVSARRLLGAPARGAVIAERGPLDFIAYLMALEAVGRGEHGHARAQAQRLLELTASATARIDVLAVLPVEHHDRVRLAADDDPRLRAAMNDALLELIDDGDAVAAHTRVVELTGDRGGRLASLEAAVARIPRH